MTRDRVSPSKKEVYVVRNLQQARILSDPLRLRILREFVGEPRTTKQVAERLGEKPTRLYRHVDALREVGLLEVIEERPKRGTIERYLQAVGSRFAVDPGLFDAHGGTDDRRHMLQSMFREVAREAEHALSMMQRDDEERTPLVARLRGRATMSKFREFRRRIAELLEDSETGEGESDTEPQVDFGGLVAIYPVPAEDHTE